MPAYNEFAALSRVLLGPSTSVLTQERISRDWRALNFTAPPSPALAAEQTRAFAALMRTAGVQVDELPDAGGLTLDAIYARDASVVTPRGVILCRMGKPARQHEPASHGEFYRAHGDDILGAIESPGTLEGGDVVWLDAHTVAVAHGYRTNDAGITQFTRLLGPAIAVTVVPLPHYRGPADVFHLMSIISPVDRDLAVVYSPLMPVAFRQWLIARGVQLVEVPDEEFESMGANVLAIAPRRCVMVDSAPLTRARLQAAGATVLTYEGSEISLKGGGGPTCLTRPLVRGA